MELENIRVVPPLRFHPFLDADSLVGKVHPVRLLTRAGSVHGQQIDDAVVVQFAHRPTKRSYVIRGIPSRCSISLRNSRFPGVA